MIRTLAFTCGLALAGLAASPALALTLCDQDSGAVLHISGGIEYSMSFGNADEVVPGGTIQHLKEDKTIDIAALRKECLARSLSGAVATQGALTLK